MEEPARGQREWRGCLSAQSLSFDGTVYSLEGTESEGSLVACRADSNPFDFYGSKPQFTLIDVLVGERDRQTEPPPQNVRVACPEASAHIPRTAQPLGCSSDTVDSCTSLSNSDLNSLPGKLGAVRASTRQGGECCIVRTGWCPKYWARLQKSLRPSSTHHHPPHGDDWLPVFLD